MSNYKYPTPQLLLKAICDAIRTKTGSNSKIAHQDIPDELNDIITEEECLTKTQELYDIINGENINYLNNNDIDIVPISKFQDHTDLVSVNLSKCNTIRTYSFSRCTNLSTINLPECITIFSNCFNNCTSLTTVNLPKCTSIGDNAFDNCTNLITINLPECTLIKSRAFYGCTNLTIVNLPKCTSIESTVFGNCSSLSAIIISNTDTIVTLYDDSASSNITSNVYVPDDLVAGYKTANNWRRCSNKIKPISSLPSNLKEEYGYD